MLRKSHLADDEGSAALEFIVAGVIMLVPLVYLILTLGIVQQHTLGTEAAARHIARAVSQADSAAAAARQTDAIVANIADQYGMGEAVSVSMQCVPAAAQCPNAGAIVLVTVSTQVALPFVPPILGIDQATQIPLEAISAQKVARTWGQ